MLEFLDKLRSKPESVRKRIAFVVSTSLSLIIFSMAWAAWTAEPSRFDSNNPPSPLKTVNKMAGDMTAQVYDMWHTTMANIEYQTKNAPEGQLGAVATSNDSLNSMVSEAASSTATTSLVVIPESENAVYPSNTMSPK